MLCGLQRNAAMASSCFLLVKWSDSQLWCTHFKAIFWVPSNKTSFVKVFFFFNSEVKIEEKGYIQSELFSFTKQRNEAGIFFLFLQFQGNDKAGISEVLRIYFDILIGLLPGMIRHSINNWLELFGCFHRRAHNIDFFLFLL